MRLMTLRLGVALSAVVGALLSGGCAEMKALVNDEPAAPPRVTETPRETPRAQSLLDYAAGLRNRNTSELGTELENLNRAYAQHRTEDNRLRLAIYHALTPGGDRARALSLLDLPPGDSAGRGRNHPIATLLIPLLQENRRSEETLLTNQQRLREEQKRSEGLQQKLDAIRDIEKKMIERTPSKGQ